MVFLKIHKSFRFVAFCVPVFTLAYEIVSIKYSNITLRFLCGVSPRISDDASSVAGGSCARPDTRSTDPTENMNSVLNVNLQLEKIM